MRQDIRHSNEWIGPPLLARIVSLLFFVAGFATTAENAEPRRVIFDGVNTEYKWSLKQLAWTLLIARGGGISRRQGSAAGRGTGYNQQRLHSPRKALAATQMLVHSRCP